MVKNYYPVVIVGGGLCGLSAAFHLERRFFSHYLILEKDDRAGGYLKTQARDGFFFDSSPHLLFSKNPYVQDLICQQLLKNQLRKFSREAYCFTGNRYLKFPYQAHNFGLPLSEVINNIWELLKVRLKTNKNHKPQDYEEWLCTAFGEGMARRYLIPYSQKLWSWNLKDISYEWAKIHVPMPKLLDLIWGAFFPQKQDFGDTKEFWYPLSGGMEILIHALKQKIPSMNLELNEKVTTIDMNLRQIGLSSGRQIQYGKMISTISLPFLVKCLKNEIPGNIKSAASELKNNYVHIINIGINGPLEGPGRTAHWLYFSEKEIIFHRLSFPHNLSSSMVPPGSSSIQVEISGSVLHPQNESTLIKETFRGLVIAGILKETDILPGKGGKVRFIQSYVLNPAYVIYDHQHEKNTTLLREYLNSAGIISTGRFGKWEYLDMGKTIMAGKEAADIIMESSTLKD